MKAVSSSTFQTIIDGGFSRQWVVDLMYDGERRLANVPVTEVEPEWNGSAFIVGSGSLRVTWSDDHATSLIPRQVGDWFSPFGGELQLDCLIGAGAFMERVPIGRFVIDEIPDAVEARMLWQGRLIHPGESFTVNVKDRLTKVARAEFPFPTRARSTSVWGEIQSVTGMPIIRNLDDAVVPDSIAYEGPKSDAVKALFDVLDAWPHLDDNGVLTARPKEWPDPVDEIRGVVSAPVTMTAVRTYNHVVVEGKDPDGDPVYGEASVRDGFLRTTNADGSVSPFGTVTYRYASEFLTTKAQCDAYAEKLLPRVARIRGVTRKVTERFNPLREVGDVLRFDGGLVRVQRVRHSGEHTQMTVEVPDE